MSSDTKQSQGLAGPIFTPPSRESKTTNHRRSSSNKGVETKSAGITPSEYDRSSSAAHAPSQENVPVRKKAKHGHVVFSSDQSRVGRRIVEFKRARTTCFENVLRHTLCGSPPKTPQINEVHAPGLENPNNNNICYMNAMIQLLFGMKCTRDLFLEGYFMVDAKLTSTERLLSYFNTGGSIAIALHRLFQQMNSERPGLSVTDFKEALVIHNMKFAEYDNTEQHDVHLLLGAILDSLSETFQNFHNKDLISNWFKNKNMDKIVCTKCKHESWNDSDSNFVVAVGIENRTNIELCLEDREEKVVGVNCTKCGKKQTFTKTSLLSPAPVLMILLKRFNADQEKVMDKVTVTKRLYLNGVDKKCSQNYVLAAIIIHIGTDLSNGHYYTLMRKGEQWLKYDDKNVSFIDIDNASVQETISENAFLVVYCSSHQYGELIGT